MVPYVVIYMRYLWEVGANLVFALIRAILVITPIRANTRFAPTLEKISL